jgi:hypothetical protein
VCILKLRGPEKYAHKSESTPQCSYWSPLRLIKRALTFSLKQGIG